MAITSITATTLSTSHPLSASELAQACGAEIDWVLQLVEVGIIEWHASAERPSDWCFRDSALRHALRARRLQRNFGVELEATALILELEDEVQRLKALLVTRNISQDA